MDRYVRDGAYCKIRPLRTHAERRDAVAAMVDGVRVRAKRGLMLPTAWEDKFLRRQKSWKWKRKAKR